MRCGFRDFRFENGAFRLNGKRIYLRCSHTGNCCPIGLEMPHDPDFLRRDLINQKMMRFNAIRFIAGVPKRYQLDLADEIGLMVYPEAYAGWCLADSPKMKERYNESVFGMIRRDRNHPCITMWGLLNETSDGPVFRHAVSLLPELRKLDDSRVVMLNSGRFDNAGGVAGIEIWRNLDRTDPCVTRNGTDHVIKALGITWQPGQVAFHPGLQRRVRGGPLDRAGRRPGRVQRRLSEHRRGAPRPTCMCFIMASPCSTASSTSQARARRRSSRALSTSRRATRSIPSAAGATRTYGADTTALAVEVKSRLGQDLGRRSGLLDPAEPQRRLELWHPQTRRPTRQQHLHIVSHGRSLNGHRQHQQSRLDGSGKTSWRPASLPACAAHRRRHPHAAHHQRQWQAGLAFGIRHRQRHRPVAHRPLV